MLSTQANANNVTDMPSLDADEGNVSIPSQKPAPGYRFGLALQLHQPSIADGPEGGNGEDDAPLDA